MPKAAQLVRVAYLLSIALWVVAFAAISLKDPHGQWDAWAIWNLRARFLYRAATEWTRAFSPLLLWSHPDYPLLIPASVARLWSFAGSDDPAAPALVSALFTFATVALLTASVRLLRGSLQGYLAGLTLLATPAFLRHGASQYADVPLAFFLLANISLVCLQERSKTRAPELLLGAGVAAGLAAWTKNEGLLCLFALTAVWLLLPAALGQGRRTNMEMLWYLAGLAPGLGTTAYFKLTLATPNDLLSKEGLAFFLERGSELSAWIKIIASVGAATASFGGWKISVVALLAVYWMFMGRAHPLPHRAGPLTAIFSLAAILTGYFLIYLATPYELSWHLATSAKRLLLQLWPSFLFTYFIFVASPEERR